MKTLEYLFEESQIHFLVNGTDRNLMINATEMAKKFDKRVDSFLRNETTKSFIHELEFTQICVNSDRSFTPNDEIKNSEKRALGTIISTHGQNGTFFCEELALKFAAWLSPKFEVWVYTRIKEITFGNYAAHWDAHARSEELKIELAKLRVDFKNNGATKEEIAFYFDKENQLSAAKNAKTAAIRNQLNLFKGQRND